MNPVVWPELSVERDAPTFALLHLVSQMLGKIAVAHTTWVNHGWNCTLQPIATGLATLPIAASDGRRFTMTLDLCRHGVALSVSDESTELLPLVGRTVATLHQELIAMLDRHHLPSSFHGRPNELEGAIRFTDDVGPRDYRPDSATRLHRALQAMLPTFERFRAGFIGKASPVHFFWGSFDLAVTRFSGRPAPPHPGGIPGLPDRITREAYSHEVSSAGFWPGGVTTPEPLFFSYAYPEPAGFADAKIEPRAASYDRRLGEFTMPYVAVSQARDPAATLMAFLQSTYDRAADLAGWERADLEREPVAP